MSVVVNVDRMRRAHERAVEVADRLDYAAWLAGLTPEHRAVHQRRPGPVVCAACVFAEMQAGIDAMNAAAARIRLLR